MASFLLPTCHNNKVSLVRKFTTQNNRVSSTDFRIGFPVVSGDAIANDSLAETLNAWILQPVTSNTAGIFCFSVEDNHEDVNREIS